MSVGRAVVALAIAGSLGLLRAPLLAAAADIGAAARSSGDAGKLLFLLEYIGTDYGAAVRDGEILDAFEYREMETFSRRLVEEADELGRRGAPAPVRAGLEELHDRVLARAPWSEVQALVSELVTAITTELRLPPVPSATADPERGRALFADYCTSCHGAGGHGDGEAARGMHPPPAAFGDPRMARHSPRQIYGAIVFGVDGTAMPAFGETLATGQIEDLAAHVLALRDVGARMAAPPGTGAAMKLAAAADDGASKRLPSPSPEGPSPADAGSADLEMAVRLESAFVRVAEELFPSVVGVTSFVREEDAAATGAPTDAPTDVPGQASGWTEPSEEEVLYPGFRRLHAGSGFIVSGDGYVLTCHHLLVGPDGRTADAIDIELADGLHQLGRLVGAEPSIGLAVLRLEIFFRHHPPKLRPVPIGDSDRVAFGQWAIALGDPWGPGKTYAVGTVAGLPERQCYQESLSPTLLRSSAQPQPGGWGGPLANIRGEVVGIVTPERSSRAGLEPLPGGVDGQGNGVTALPINVALGIYEALKLKESRESPWLGFSVLDLRAARKRLGPGATASALPRTGVYIDDVFAPSPASRARIRAGDSLVAIDGRRLYSVLDFQKWLYLSGIGRTVDLEIVRDGAARHEHVTIERRPPEATPR